MKKIILLLAIISCCFGSASSQNNSINVALNKPATANSSTSTEPQNRAFDGDLTTNWCTPGYVGWIQVDLQNQYAVDSIVLYVNQYRPGNTVHEVKTSEDMSTWEVVKTFSEYTSSNQRLSVHFLPALSKVRGVMLNTLSSNSWVGWYEIEVYSNSNPVGVKEIGKKNVQIYPNPATDRLTIDGASRGRIELYDLQGQVVRQVDATDQKTTIDVSTLTKGVYTLKMITNEGMIVRKMVKK